MSKDFKVVTFVYTLLTLCVSTACGYDEGVVGFLMMLSLFIFVYMIGYIVTRNN